MGAPRQGNKGSVTTHNGARESQRMLSRRKYKDRTKISDVRNQIMVILQERVARRAQERGSRGARHGLFLESGTGYRGLFHLGKFVKLHT